MMISPDAIARLNEQYGCEWHLKMPAHASQVRVQGETNLSASVPPAGVTEPICAMRVQRGRVLVLHHYALYGYQDVAAPWNPSQRVKEQLAAHSIAEKLSWKLQTKGGLAFQQLSRVGTASEGHGVLGSYSVQQGNMQPIIIGGNAMLEMVAKGQNPASGIAISPDGGYLVGELSGYILSIP